MFSMQSASFIIISDGACSGNPGPGGWGMILVTPEEKVREYGGHEPATTNNRMELMGFYRGMQEVYHLREQFPNARILHAISDSKYVLDGAQKYVPNWAKNGWKTSTGGDVKNQDLWEKVIKEQQLLRESGFRFEYELVKGHSGHEGNERVDQIAVKYVREEPISLYAGKLQDYSVSLAPGKPFEKTYLSLVDGKLCKSKTWDECKALVEGKRGAKYKKVVSASEEKETLAMWGLST
jgi:ribonuclease HI